MQRCEDVKISLYAGILQKYQRGSSIPLPTRTGVLFKHGINLIENDRLWRIVDLTGADSFPLHRRVLADQRQREWFLCEVVQQASERSLDLWTAPVIAEAGGGEDGMGFTRSGSRSGTHAAKKKRIIRDSKSFRFIVTSLTGLQI